MAVKGEGFADRDVVEWGQGDQVCKLAGCRRVGGRERKNGSTFITNYLLESVTNNYVHICCICA